MQTYSHLERILDDALVSSIKRSDDDDHSQIANLTLDDFLATLMMIDFIFERNLQDLRVLRRDSRNESIRLLEIVYVLDVLLNAHVVMLERFVQNEQFIVIVLRYDEQLLRDSLAKI